MPSPIVDAQPNQSPPPESHSTSNTKKAVVVGIYGIQGCGKTTLLNQLKESLDQEHFSFYDGSQKIANLVTGGLEAFKQLPEQKKVDWRQLAISTIGKESSDSGKVAIVAGHFMLWSEEKEAVENVYTKTDLNVFTHILYLDVPAEKVYEQRLRDSERRRPFISVDNLKKWQEDEKTQLRRLCYQHGILLSFLSPDEMLVNKVSALLLDFQSHDEEHNLSLAKTRLDEIIVASKGKLETVLVLDGDRTLTAEDSGALFWKLISNCSKSKDDKDPLKTLFKSQLGYSYTAFRQATLLHEEIADEKEFEDICGEVASAMTMHPEFVSLLHLAATQEHVCAVVVTCGLRRVWEKVLEKEGLSKAVKVIGGGRIADGYVVTAEVKAAMVGRLSGTHHMHVLAFGDSPLDLPMLSNADQAIVVVIEEHARSKTMDAALIQAVDNGGLSARQVLLPSSASPRLDITKLPVVQVTNQEFINSILLPRSNHQSPQVHHATDRKATKLLMTPMRDAAISGPALQNAHRRVGWYLATEFLTEMLGVEPYAIPHVQGHPTDGYRLIDEKKTSIVALMRGGEPMAQGVNEAFPSAMFIHAKLPQDIKAHHMQEQHTIILVDSVVNSGKSVVEFVEHIRSLHATIRIVVVSGVVQAQSVDKGMVSEILEGDSNFCLVALRLSDNKFTGKGTTDTGNRLFNTTRLD
jgi:uracil phosphoribosyltransferase/adenylate kinase/phosphoserine phosphatase